MIRRRVSRCGRTGAALLLAGSGAAQEGTGHSGEADEIGQGKEAVKRGRKGDRLTRKEKRERKAQRKAAKTRGPVFHTLRRGREHHRFETDLWLGMLDMVAVGGWTPPEAGPSEEPSSAAFARLRRPGASPGWQSTTPDVYSYFPAPPLSSLSLPLSTSR